MGNVGEGGVWALGVRGFVSRKLDVAGTLGMAMSFEAATGVKTVHWMSYETDLNQNTDAQDTLAC